MIKLNTIHDKTLIRICIDEYVCMYVCFSLKNIYHHQCQQGKSGKRQGYPLLLFLLNNILEVLDSSVRQEKRRGGKTTKYRGFKGKTTEVSLSAHDMTTYKVNSKEKTKTFLELIRESAT